MVKRAIIFGPGGTSGAYSAGVAATFGRVKGRRHFDRGYACSVGTYPLTFMFSGQPDVIENTWKNHIGGNNLVDLSFMNFLTGNVMRLSYLEEIFQSDRSRLDLETLFSEDPKITYVMTNAKTGKPNYFTPTKENVFRSMSASCSIPFVSRPVNIGGSNYFDGGFSDPFPVSRAKQDGCEEIVVVINHHKDFSHVLRRRRNFGRILGLLSAHRPVLASKLWGYADNTCRVLDALENDPSIRVIRPDGPTAMLSNFDVNLDNISKTFDRGVEDAYKFLRE
ncbi:MAG: patatin-like phospholipase family protein [Nanoarchaeota archaeon]